MQPEQLYSCLTSVVAISVVCYALCVRLRRQLHLACEALLPALPVQPKKRASLLIGLRKMARWDPIGRFADMVKSIFTPNINLFYHWKNILKKKTGGYHGRQFQLKQYNMVFFKYTCSVNTLYTASLHLLHASLWSTMAALRVL
jgi:hypothetical protein